MRGYGGVSVLNRCTKEICINFESPLTTFEIDLFNSGAHKAFAVAIKDLTSNKKIHERFDALAEDPDAIDPKQLLKDINSVGKGRFAQRLGAVLQKDKLDVCPPYIADALSYLKGKLE